MKKIYKKLGLLSVLALSLAACGSPGESGQSGETKEEPKTEESAQSPAKEDSKKEAEEKDGSAKATDSDEDVAGTVDLANVDADDDEAFQKEKASQEKIQVAYSGGLCTSPSGLALAKGYYKDEGLDVELVKSESGTTDAVGTGHAAIGSEHITTVLVPLVNGVNAQLVGGVHTGCKSLYVLEDSGIENTTDLKGKTVAIHDGIGQSDQNIALRFFEADGIGKEEVKFKNTDTSATVQAMENGEIEATIFTDQFAMPFVREGKLRRIRALSFDDDFKDETCCGIVVNKAFAKENPIAAKRLVRAIRKAADWAGDNTEDFIDELEANDWVSGERQDAVDFAESLNFHVTNDGTAKTVRNVIEDYKRFDIFPADQDTDEIFSKVWSPWE